MFNYILPPIIIVISVSVLIMFLFRKAEQIPAQDFILDENKRNKEKSGAKITAAIGQFGLKLLERLMHRSKLLSLKFHNLSNAWFQTIREKRQRDAELQKEALEKRVQDSKDEPELKPQITLPDAPVSPVSRQTKLRPMVRETAVMPQRRQTRIREKNQMEEALIKRIAINPRDIEAYERLGDYYLEKENFQDSLECFRQVLKLSPSHIKARMRIRRLERMK